MAAYPNSEDEINHRKATKVTDQGQDQEDSGQIRDKSRDQNQRQGRVHQRHSHEPDAESELSELESLPHSPENHADEIVVSDRAGEAGHPQGSPGEQEGEAEVATEAAEEAVGAERIGANDEDDVMVDAPAGRAVFNSLSKRKRSSTNANGLADAAMSSPSVKAESNPNANGRPKSRGSKPPRTSLAGGKGVILGHWRDSPVPEETRKHSVIGFIDIRDRLRTRIQGVNLLGEHVSNLWPLPPKTGASWVTFDGIYFLPHLVGLDQLQVKEYVRLRLDAHEQTAEAKKAAELAAIEKAVHIVRQSAINDSSAPFGPPPQLAYGADLPEAVKRRRTSGNFTPAPNANGVNGNHGDISSERTLDPLHGTRPTRILLGCWTKSDATQRNSRHAIYGILGANDMFRVKLVRETRTGEYYDGNFPQGAGALWVSYEEVDFDDHLRNLTRAEIKEYCRIRQHQIDHGESAKEQTANETQAVYEAQTRVSVGVPITGRQSTGPGSYVPIQAEEVSPTTEQPNGRMGLGGQELRTSRRVEARQQQQQQQQEKQQQTQQVNGRNSISDHDGRNGSLGAMQKTDSLAQREIARAEAAQGRADLHATHRERASAAAATAANAAAAAAASGSYGENESRFHQSENMRRLNDVWARQESMRAKNGGEDIKIYDGIKYERKPTGPFMGKLVSHGNIISIDGEDYVEYRVLTKPSFF
jgi:hypothetical protein